MGALQGSIAVRRYAVLDPLPAKPRERLTKGLRAHAFLPLDPKSDLDRASGWVSILDGDDADLQPEKLYFAAPGGEQLRFALRTDVIKPPRAEVKRQAAARAHEVEAEEGRELSRRERRALQEEVARTLKLRAFPRVRVVDAVWNLDGGKLWFWSQTKAANETFIDLFAKSFGLRLEVEGPARWAAGAVGSPQLGKLEPTRELWQGFAGVRPLATLATTDDDEE
jgi:DNA recombination-dependent growth factor C